ADNDAERLTPAPEAPKQAEALLRQHQLAGKRAKLALELLDLGGLPEERTRSLREALERVSPEKADPGAIDKAAQALQQTWNKELPAQLKEYLAEGKAKRDPGTLGKAVRLSFVEPPFPEEALALPESNAAVLYRREEVRLYRQWLADWYRRES